MKPQNFFQRFLSETPPFWIKVQVFALIILSIAGECSKMQILPPGVYLVISGACFAVAFVAQLAIHDAPLLQAAVNDPSSLLEHLPEIASQVGQIQQIITQPAGIVQDLKNIAVSMQTLASPPPLLTAEVPTVLCNTSADAKSTSPQPE